MKHGPVYPLVTIKIDARGVGNPAQLAAREVHDIFAIAYPAVGEADLGNVAPLADQTVHMQMEVLGRSPGDERASVMRRLMAMCISDLSRGIRQTLEDASAHAELVRARPEMFRADDDFRSEDERAEAIVAAVERFKTEALSKAQAMRYPQLTASAIRGSRLSITSAMRIRRPSSRSRTTRSTSMATSTSASSTS